MRATLFWTILNISMISSSANAEEFEVCRLKSYPYYYVTMEGLPGHENEWPRPTILRLYQNNTLIDQQKAQPVPTLKGWAYVGHRTDGTRDFSYDPDSDYFRSAFYKLAGVCAKK